MIIKIFIPLITSLYVFSAWANCAVEDISGAITADDKKLLQALDYEWLTNAKVCSVGPYRVAVPARPNGPKDRRIRIFIDGKPVMQREPGSTLLFNPNSRKADLTHPIVNVWHGTGEKDIDRLWYQTVADKDGNYVSTYDVDFDGQPDTRTIWKGQDIVESYAWYKNRWYKIKDQCITIEDKCIPAKYERGQWRLQEKN